MCDYCGCRSRPLVARLGAEHDKITSLAAVVHEALGADDDPAARRALRDLVVVLQPHSDLEETTLYPELAAGGIESDGLYADHALIDATIRDALAGSVEAWAAVPTALGRLARHIQTEEYDLFPAAHQLLSDSAWDRIDQHVHPEHGHPGHPEHCQPGHPEHGHPEPGHPEHGREHEPPGGAVS